MKICHHCGQDVPQNVEWHGLMVTGFGHVYWRGIKVAGITRTQTRILVALAARGEASHGSLEMTCASATGGCIKVHVCNLRRRLKKAGVPVDVVNEHGIGYHLELAE